MVAPAPNAAILNGEVDWVYEEELETRSNYFWSPDSKHLAYLQMNETEVPQYPIDRLDSHPRQGGHAALSAARRSQSRCARGRGERAQAARRCGSSCPFNAGQDYIPRFGWVDRKTLWIETLTRDHKHRDLYFADACHRSGASGAATDRRQVLRRQLRRLRWATAAIVLTNWSDGHNHLYLYSYDQAHPGAHGQAGAATDQAASSRWARFTRGSSSASSSTTPRTRATRWSSSYGRSSFDGERKQLSAGAGFHAGNFAPAGGAFVDKQSTRLDPPTLRLCQAAGKCSVFWQTRALEPYHLRAPEQLEVKAHDGTTLYATLLLPEGATNPASVPLIVNPYGGPGAQAVANRWGDGAALRRVAGAAWLCRAPRRQSRHGRAAAAPLRRPLITTSAPCSLKTS